MKMSSAEVKQKIETYLNIEMSLPLQETTPDYLKLLEVSRFLEISKRTIQRKLKEMNTSFSDILDDVRKQKAKEYLKNCSIRKVAKYLGYKERTSLTGAFKRWYNMTPEQYKNTLVLENKNEFNNVPKLCYRDSVKNYLKNIIENSPDKEKRKLLTLPASAKYLNIGRSTLSNYLKKEGSTFKNILTEVRKEYVEKLFDNTQVKILSQHLGYSDRSTFTKCYTKWYGRTPAYAKYLRKINDVSKRLLNKENGVI